MSIYLFNFCRVTHAGNSIAGISLDSTSVSQNQADADAYYGGYHSFKQILSGGVPVPRAARSLLCALSRNTSTQRRIKRRLLRTGPVFRTGFFSARYV